MSVRRLLAAWSLLPLAFVIVAALPARADELSREQQIADIEKQIAELNRRHLRISHLLTWLAMIGLSLVSVHALLASGVVFASLAAVNGQEWYRRNFRQSYSVEAA